MEDQNYTINLDEFCEDVFYKMEEISEGGRGHRYDVKAPTHGQALFKLIIELTPFLSERLLRDDLEES